MKLKDFDENVGECIENWEYFQFYAKDEVEEKTSKSSTG